MAVVYMMYGLPGTGKSTHLKQLGGEYVVICPDEYLYENGVYNWSPQRVAEAWERAYEALNVAVKGHLSIVFDATFLTKAARARFMNRVKSFCPDALFKSAFGATTCVLQTGVSPKRLWTGCSPRCSRLRSVRVSSY